MSINKYYVIRTILFVQIYCTKYDVYAFMKNLKISLFRYSQKYVEAGV